MDIYIYVYIYLHMEYEYRDKYMLDTCNGPSEVCTVCIHVPIHTSYSYSSFCLSVALTNPDALLQIFTIYIRTYIYAVCCPLKRVLIPSND